MIVKTESGSIYEVDLRNKKIRRLHGESDATPRMGKDFEWKVYDTLFVESGGPMMVIWDWVERGEQVIAKCTSTSIVKSISL